MKKFIFILITLLCFQFSFSQNTSDSISSSQKTDTLNLLQSQAADSFLTKSDLQKNSFISSPYRTSFVKDGLAIAAAAGVTVLGYTLIKNKNDLTPEQLAGKTRDKLPFFDRGNAGYYSDQANKDSYILFDASYAIPLVAALFNKNEKAKFGQVMVMYLETIAITGSMYTITAGLVYRSRPFVYGTRAPLEKRLDKGGQRSFYGGHVATTAAATFFTAKVFHDFNPGSKLTPYLYASAGALTVVMGYLRYKAGYHFLSDCILSGIIGTATGILVPEFHRNKKFENVSLSPYFQEGSRGVSLTYKF